MIDGDHLNTFDYVDMSIAVSGPKGLMVPVVRNAEGMSFAGVEKTGNDIFELTRGIKRNRAFGFRRSLRLRRFYQKKRDDPVMSQSGYDQI